MTASVSASAQEFAERVRAGDRRSIARAISFAEDALPVGAEIIRLLYPYTGRAIRVGITGPPGVGKSTLISALITVCRGRGLDVGVVSVDPSSPFTQGAVLGDRIRLADHFLDRNVFIRSMGTRGHLGGLAEATLQACLILDAAGKDVVFVETVGVGQSEIEIASVADTVILALMPGSGDSIQALKAGVMEIPDIIVVNKKDHPAAEITLQEVRSILNLAPRPDGWDPPLLATNAASAEGVPELWEAMVSHRGYLEAEGLLARRRGESLEREVMALATYEMQRWLARRAGSDPRLGELLAHVKDRRLDPLSAVRAILVEVFGIPAHEL